MISTIELNDISTTIDYGMTASASSEPTSSRFLRITDIQDRKVCWDSVPYVDANPSEQIKYGLEIGDIVFARTGATTGKSFLIRHCPESSVFASYLIRVRPKNDKVDPGYLSAFFSTQNYWNQIRSKSTGSAQVGVNSSKLKSLKVPLPPLPEQKRIAAILDQADALREKRRAAIAKLDELLQSVFLDMFGDPVTNPKGWPLGCIGDLLKDASYGTSSKASTAGTWPILRMNNITYTGGWNFTNLKYIDLSEKEETKYLVCSGDILFNRTNSKELVGKTAVYREKDSKAYAGYLIRCRTNKYSVPDYISSYLNSRHGKLTLMGKCKSIIGMANINAKELQSIKILIPPIELQKDYEQRVSAILEFKHSLEPSMGKLDTLFHSLQQRAFRGEL